MKRVEKEKKRGEKGVDQGGVYRKGVVTLSPCHPDFKKPIVLAIDPGISGAIVVTDGDRVFSGFAIPVIVWGRETLVDYGGLVTCLFDLQYSYPIAHIFLERAIPMAMGSKGAFTYGRGFEAIVIAISSLALPMTMVEPGKWTREMHEGISKDLKPKAKSLIAVQRLYPHLVGSLPQKPKGGLKDGPVDALLIAGYGLRRLQAVPPVGSTPENAATANLSQKAPRKEPLPKSPKPRVKPLRPGKTRNLVLGKSQDIDVVQEDTPDQDQPADCGDFF